MNVMAWVPAAAVLLVAAAAGAAGEFHVAVGGDDAGPGTKDKPFATIARAQAEVRKLAAAGLKQDVTVVIRGGTYRIAEPIVFGPADSGTEQHAITYAAAPGEEVIVSGGRAVAGWRDEGGGVWAAKLPDGQAGTWAFRELFVNGRRAVRARHPNDGYLRVVTASPDRMSHFTFGPDDIPAKATADGAELVFVHDWSISRVPVGQIDHARRTLTPAAKIGRQHRMMVITGYERHPRYFLEGALAFLDAPGEWHLDAAAGVVRYRPRPGETIGAVEAVAPVAEKLLVVRGDAEEDRPVRNLHFVGLVLEHCAWPLPEGGYAGVQATYHPGGADGSWRAYVTPAVQFELARDCRFERGAVRHVGGAGIAFGRGCRNCRMLGSVVADVGGNGVMIGEDRSRAVGGKPWWQAAPEQAAGANVVKNCVIEQCGRQFFGAVGVWVGMAEKTVIAHNEVRDAPYTGVSVGWMWNPTPTPCKATLVENNHIHHVMQVLSDGGGIYTLGIQPAAVLRGNLIHDVPANAGRAESNGMFLDEGTTDLLIEGNVIHSVARSPLRFHRATVNRVRNNVLVVAPRVPPIRYNATNAADIKQENNSVVAGPAVTDVPAKAGAAHGGSDKEPTDVGKLIEAVRRRAGPEPAHRDKLPAQP